MASKKKQPEGIALLSMYNDEEDEDMEDLDEEEEEQEEEEEKENEKAERREAEGEEQYDDYRDSRMVEGDDSMDIGERVFGGGESANDGTPQIVNDDAVPDKGRFGNSTPQQPQVSPQRESVTPAASDSSRRSRRGTLTIVDYGHDEVAMSPEPEEGEIYGSGRVMFGEELQTANGMYDVLMSFILFPFVSFGSSLSLF
ncbi:uncharacterized protein LOC136066393 [Quercus suber]|uniref:uncharacterized protein LOC136066393 n=1 Tax=Quercus suber TaxID=58331 RepID=UPI0032DF488A